MIRTYRRAALVVGAAALVGAPAAFADPVTAPVTVSGSVPLELDLSAGATTSFGTFAPAVARDYATTVAATATSTASGATLTIADASGLGVPGHLLNTSGGAFSLLSALKASGASTAAGATGSPLTAITAASQTLVTYAQPVAADSVTIGLQQHIDASEPLRSGTYGKTLTITLSSSTP